MTSFRFPKRPQPSLRRSGVYPLHILLYVVPLMLLLAACNIDQPNNPTPTVEILISPSATASRTPTSEASRTPTFTASPQVNIGPIVVVTPVPNNVPSMPTSAVTAAPLETPTPWSYIIKEGDNLGGILIQQPWGYNGNDIAIQRAVVQLNNMISPDILPGGAGTELLIPHLTWTPIPEGVELTQTAAAEMGGVVVGDNLFVAPGTTFECYTVKEGDTMGEIAANFSASFELLSAQNQNLNWGGCDFTNPTGGPNCNPFITINQCVKVPWPTAVPSFTPTASGSETPTATPTRSAATLIYPPDGAIIPGGTFRLDWVSTGLLASDQVYLIEVQDVTAGTAPTPFVTRENSFDLPGTLVPSDGQTHQFQWRVTVVKKNAEGTYALSDGQGPWRPFQWHSR